MHGDYLNGWSYCELRRKVECPAILNKSVIQARFYSFLHLRTALEGSIWQLLGQNYARMLLNVVSMRGMKKKAEWMNQWQLVQVSTVTRGYRIPLSGHKMTNDAPIWLKFFFTIPIACIYKWYKNCNIWINSCGLNISMSSSMYIMSLHDLL